MDLKLVSIPSKKLIGKKLSVTLNNDLTFQLWSSFMPSRREIQHIIGTDLYSIQVFSPETDFRDFTPDTSFDKWAAIEVSDVDMIPEGMEPLILAGGEYVTFTYLGTPERFGSLVEDICRTWMPTQGLVPDNSRPHFQIMGEKYKRDDPMSEEEAWIPVKRKA
jgi:AraC family transcriptional regulator